MAPRPHLQASAIAAWQTQAHVIVEMAGNCRFTLTIGNGKRIRLQRLKNGVPQESVLAPLLFNTYFPHQQTTVSRKYTMHILTI